MSNNCTFCLQGRGIMQMLTRNKATSLKPKIQWQIPKSPSNRRLMMPLK